MRRFACLALAGTVLTLLPAFAALAGAQTLKLTIHVSNAGASATVVSGTRIQCGVLTPTCVVYVNAGATVRLSAADTTANAGTASAAPGRFSGGTGPAAGCALSTCTFTMTADADVNVGPGSGQVATLTMTTAGDGGGRLMPDGVWIPTSPWTVAYLQGSSVELDAVSAAAARFSGYSSGTGDAAACGSASHCTFTLNGNSSVTGTFRALTSFTVTPSSAVAGPGGPPVTFTTNGTYSDAVSAPISAGNGDWASAPPLPFASDSPAAAGLGGRVYAMGGQTISFAPTSVTNQLTAFDPVANAWTPLNPMIVKRTQLGATTAGGLLYAIGGRDNNSTTLASMERYDPDTDSWTMRASMSTPRRGLVAASVNGTIYAAGGSDAGGTPIATLEAYNPATDTWTPRAPMPTPRSFAGGGVIDGILYVAGGTDGTLPVSTVVAYDPASNTWTTKAPIPGFLGTTAAAVADGVLYVIVQTAVYAYDPVTDSWSARVPLGGAGAPLGGFRANLAATSLNGIVYAIGGSHSAPFCCNKSVNTVETFADSLRWSSSAPAVARIDQTGVATPLGAGTATIIASVAGQTCGAHCPTFIVPPPTDLSLDLPGNNTVATVGAGFTIGGWALNRAAVSGTGVDAIHVYAAPASGAAIFLGAAAYGGARADVAAVYGSQFTNIGFTVLNAGQALPAGTYTILAFAHNALTQQFDAVRTATIQLQPPVSQPFIAVDSPQPSQVVTSAFEVGGWALDAGAPSGTGVDSVQFYIQPQGAPAPGVFIGTGSYGGSRPDVGAVYGSRFTNTGYHFTITGLSPGSFTLNVYAHSLVTNSYSIVRSVPITVSATALLSIDAPAAEAAITSPTFLVGGWSIDRTVEGTASSGSGVDALHLYAFPDPGSGQAPIFIGVANIGISRPDVGAAYGVRYDTSGYELAVDRAALGLTPGTYNIAVVSHSAVSGTFNNVAVVRVTLQ